MAGGDGPSVFSNEESSRFTLGLPFRTDAGVKGKDMGCSSKTSKESCKSTLDDSLGVS